MLYFAKGSEQTSFSNDEIREALFSSLDKLGKREKVLAIPPDFTRFHSQAGILTELTWQYYKDDLVDIARSVKWLWNDATINDALKGFNRIMVRILQ